MSPNTKSDKPKYQILYAIMEYFKTHLKITNKMLLAFILKSPVFLNIIQFLHFRIHCSVN